MGKPIIVAICGKSAAGKDTLLQEVKYFYTKISRYSEHFNFIISDTTRKPRLSESNGEDYFFVSPEEFIEAEEKGQYLEWSTFRGWFYGTNKKQVKKDKINVGVFNVQGLKSLAELQDEYTIIVVYLKCPWQIRLERSYCRNFCNLNTEMFRRMIIDFFDFLNIRSVLKHFKYHITLNSEYSQFAYNNFMDWFNRVLEYEIKYFEDLDNSQ